jgi:hypothetical protein
MRMRFRHAYAIFEDERTTPHQERHREIDNHHVD